MSASWTVDLKNTAVGGLSFVPASRTASEDGTAIDMQLAEGQCFGILHTGALDFTTGNETYAFKLQESTASGSGYTDITDATFTVAASALNIINFTRTKRYIRAVATFAGTTPILLCSVQILGRKKISGTGAGSQTS